MVTDAEKRYIAVKKLPSLAPRPEAGKKYKSCDCGSSCWMVDYSKVKVLVCGDCGKQWLKGDVYVNA